MLVLLQALGPACKDSNVSRVRLKLEDPRAGKGMPAARPASVPPVCPAAGVAPLQPSQPGTAHHKVILTWNASAPSNYPDSTAVGYCLYRSKTKQAAKTNPVCQDCERINAAPVTPTGCVDDLVADGVLYYYVVTAINAKGRLSTSSNEIPVAIPSATQTVRPVPANSVPLCRGSVGLNPPGIPGVSNGRSQ